VKQANGGRAGGRTGRRAFNQRCAVRVMYCRNKSVGQWRAHGRYIARESAAQDHNAGFDSHSDSVAPTELLERWQTCGDPKFWKFIISPEFGERLDMKLLTRDLMARIEKDLGTRLEWVAVVHVNTEHLHVHVALRGVRDDKSDLNLTRDYVRQGIRGIAEDLCTRQLGHRNELDAIAAERREIQERRCTSLDRMIGRANTPGLGGADPNAEYFIFRPAPFLTGRAREQHIAARLLVLQQMGLVHEETPGEWRVRSDFQTVLKAMQRTIDRQKMLASHGVILSDERLQLVVYDPRHQKSLEGRVLVHGEDELGRTAGRHYFLLEGTDARVHMIYYTPELEDARSRGQLRTNSFIRLQKQFENGRPVLEVEDLGDSEKVLRNKRYLEGTASSLLKRGITPEEDGWGGWLGRYQAAVAEATTNVKRARAGLDQNLTR
jgi:hypothetical protein